MACIHTSSFYGNKKHLRLCVPPLDSDDDIVDNSSDDETYTVNTDEYLESSSSDTEDVEGLSSPPDLPTGRPKQKPKRHILWKRNHTNQEHEVPEWTGRTEDIPTFDSPYLFFKSLINDDILLKIVEESNLYSVQKDVSSPLNLCKNELEQFLGTIFYMSLIGMPGCRRYWSANCNIPLVSEVMSRQRWEQIKRNLHFTDNSKIPEGNQNRLIKVSEVLEVIRKNLKSYPLEKCLCVDEQIIPFKGRTSLKQYMPKKPKKWGYKVFVLSGVSGVAYDFEVYAGASNHPSGLPDVGISGNVVLRLTQCVPKHQNYQIYYDNYFCSPELQIELAKVGIQSLGTVRMNRVPNNKMPTDAQLKEEGRGTAIEHTALVENVNLVLTKWQDNKSVNLLSTFVGEYPELSVRRWDRKTKQYIEVNCPSVVKYYKFMGGVDLLDSLIALYRTKIRSKKYYLRFFFHMLDLCTVVAWLHYRNSSESPGIPQRQQLSLFDFKAHIAQSLCWSSKTRKKGRPSFSPQDSSVKRRKTSSTPNVDVSKDKLDHWPIYVENAGRCKSGGCQKLTKVKCTKCQCYLCFVPNRNCFFHFHN